MSAVTTIEELVTLLGLEVKSDVLQKARKFEQGLDTIGKYAVAATAAISATAASIGYFVERATNSAADLYKFSKLTGESAQSVQQWAYAVEQAGGNAASVKSDIMGLVKSMNPVMPGEFNQGLFLLGMYEQKYKNIDNLLMGLSDRFKKMSAGEALNWGSHIGLSPDTIMMFREIKDLGEIKRQVPFLLSDQEIKQAFEFEKQVKRIESGFKTIGEHIAIGLVPVIDKVLDKSEAWVRKNKELISSKVNSFLEGVATGFGKVADVVGSVVGWLEKGVPFIRMFIDGLSDANTVGNVTAIIFGGIAVILGLMALKWVAIGAAVAVAALAIDDFLTYMKGGKSLIGDWIDGIKEIYKEFATKFPNIDKLIKLVWTSLKLLASLSLDAVILMIKDLWTGLKNIADATSTVLNGVAWLLNLLLGPFVDQFGSPQNGPREGDPAKKKVIQDNFDRVVKMYGAAPQVPVMPVAGQTNNSSSSVSTVDNSQKIGTVNVTLPNARNVEEFMFGLRRSAIAGQ